MKKFFTSESVTEGHPDKICDQISDAILDEILKQDKNARVACETLVTTGTIFIAGEITFNGNIDYQKIARETVEKIGYNRAKYGFDSSTCSVITSINKQSADIAQGVDKASDYVGDELDKIGAGDQGMMFGFASNETESYMPMPITLAHKLTHKLSEVRKNGKLKYLRPDGKSQVTVEYIDGVPTRVDTVVISSQHSPDVSIEQLREDILEYVVKATIDKKLIDKDTKFFINPTGKFVIGGPMGDCGLTGRKIIVDTYGGYAPHGGGAFSGKDPTKVDRSGAYMARYVCKNLVASGLCDKAELEIAYAIGVAKPVSILVNSFNTGKVSDEKLAEIVMKEFDFRPQAIIKTLDLKKPIYNATAKYGHFGRDEFSWEKTNKVNDLKKYIK